MGLGIGIFLLLCFFRTILSILQYWTLKFLHHTKIVNNLLIQHINHVCLKKGHILEIGFGAGTTANMIQKHNIKSHTIIEKEDYYFNKLCKWANNKPNVQVVHGDWINKIPKDVKYDGIFCDLWDDQEDYNRRKELCDLMDEHTKQGSVFVCVTKKALDKKRYIEKGYTYKEIEIKPVKIKWYHLTSQIIRWYGIKNNNVLRYHNSIPKIIYK
jgi:phospholipid N-methyltransferase